jgi:tripartite-type tricarboxylate transporter receptor subunit TctC
VRPLAVTTAVRSEALPDVPRIGDFVPGYEASAINGLAAPANTPAAIIERLNKEINIALADPRIKAQLADQAVWWRAARRPTTRGCSPQKPRSGAR